MIDPSTTGVRMPLPSDVIGLVDALNDRVRELHGQGLASVVVVAHEYGEPHAPALHQVQAQLFALPVSAPAEVFPIRPVVAQRAGVA